MKTKMDRRAAKLARLHDKGVDGEFTPRMALFFHASGAVKALRIVEVAGYGMQTRPDPIVMRDVQRHNVNVVVQAERRLSPNRIDYTPRDERRVREMRADGFTMPEIAAAYRLEQRRHAAAMQSSVQVDVPTLGDVYADLVTELRTHWE